MKTRAAVAFEAKQPLEIAELDLAGPRAGVTGVAPGAGGIPWPLPLDGARPGARGKR